MSNVEQMEDNISYMKEFKPLNSEEQSVVEKARDIFNSFPKVPCTACAYCMKGCPKNIAIYGTFQAVNIYNMYNDLAGAKGKYEWNTSGHGLGKSFRMHQVRKVRAGLSAAYPYPGRAGKSGGSAGKIAGQRKINERKLKKNHKSFSFFQTDYTDIKQKLISGGKEDV